MVQRKVRSEKLLARRVTHLPEKRPLQILIFLARDLATFLGAQSQSSQPLSVFTRASNLDARKEIHSGRLDRRARSISRIRSACIEVQRSSCVIMITTAQGTFGVLLVPKKCPALVNIKTVVSVRQVASGGGATDVGTDPTSADVSTETVDQMVKPTASLCSKTYPLVRFTPRKMSGEDARDPNQSGLAT